MGSMEDLFHRVQRTGADIAVDDADGAESQSKETLRVLLMGVQGSTELNQRRETGDYTPIRAISDLLQRRAGHNKHFHGLR